jgi:hypothetical protein
MRVKMLMVSHRLVFTTITLDTIEMNARLVKARYSPKANLFNPFIL